MEGLIHIVGLTGGIASGKSTVADIILARGYPVVDADQLARDVVEPGQPALATLVDLFGEEILDPDGQLDRRALGRIVFEDAEARRRLESVMHPAIARKSAEAFVAHREAGCALAFYNAALLVETGSWKGMAALVVVSAPVELQLARILSRDPDLDRADAEARIAAQMPLAEKEARADFVIRNDADLATLEHRVDETLQALRDRFGLGTTDG